VAGGATGYDAFISYSHALDGALARGLQIGVERFAKPWYRPRALRVFRDTTSLSANPGLWSSIEAALASSTWLVLMASPAAARSPWVDREVAWWLANKSPQRLLVVLTEGELVWDGDAGHGDVASAALPPALRGAFAEEPRWVDLRWLRDAEQVDQSNPRLRECVADIAAAVREVPKDELVGEHIRQHRRTLRLARSGVSALAMLLIAAVVAAVVAMGQRNQAIAAQHTAIARGMMAQAEGMRDRDPRGALQFGIAANQLDPSPVTQASLMQTLASSRYRHTLAASSVHSMAFSLDGHTLTTDGSDDTVILWDLSDHTHPRELGQTPTRHTTVVQRVAFSPDGHTLVTNGSDDTAILWDLSDRTHPRRLGQPLTSGTSSVQAVAFSPDGHTFATSADETVILWDLSDRTQPRQLGQPLTGNTDLVYSVAFSPDGHTLATASVFGTVILWDLAPLNELRRDMVREACTRAGGSLNESTWNFYAPGVSYQDPCPRH
jgi:hypothetical protein